MVIGVTKGDTRSLDSSSPELGPVLLGPCWKYFRCAKAQEEI